MNERFITLEQFAERNGLSIDEARKKVKSAEYRKYYKVIDNTELVNENIPEVKQEKHNTEIIDNSKEIERLNQLVDSLRKEIADKDRIITDKDKQIADYALRFADLATQAQTIATQAQVLQLSEKKEVYKELTAPSSTADKRKGFWSRLFKGNRNEYN